MTPPPGGYFGLILFILFGLRGYYGCKIVIRNGLLLNSSSQRT